MYSTYVIIIAKEREMKNLPVQGREVEDGGLLWIPLFLLSFSFPLILSFLLLSLCAIFFGLYFCFLSVSLCVWLSLCVLSPFRFCVLFVRPSVFFFFLILCCSLLAWYRSLVFSVSLPFLCFCFVFGFLFWFLLWSSPGMLCFWCSCCWRWSFGAATEYEVEGVLQEYNGLPFCFSLLFVCPPLVFHQFPVFSFFSVLFVPLVFLSSSLSFCPPWFFSGFFILSLPWVFILLPFLWPFCPLFVPKHVRPCLRKNRGLTVLPLQDCWSRQRGLWNGIVEDSGQLR